MPTLARARSAAAANAAKARNPATLLGLPEGITQQIIEQIVLDGVGTRTSSSRRSTLGARRLEPNLDFKDAYQRLSPLTGASKALRRLTYAYLGKEVTLHEDNSNTLLFQHKSHYWSKMLLRQVQKMRTCMSTGMKMKPEQMWPQYINFFQTLVPSITHLELYSEFSVDDDNYPRKMSGEPLYSVSRLDQERRFKLFFLAYLTLRHQSLNRMILPGDCVQTIDGTIYHHLIAEKAFIDTPFDCSFIWEGNSPSAGEDNVLNATLIRRYKWTELCAMPDTRFIVVPFDGYNKNGVLCSEVDYDDRQYWKMVDTRAYQPASMTKANQWRSHTVDELIKSCRTFQWREKWAAAALATALAAARKAGNRRLCRRLGKASAQE